MFLTMNIIKDSNLKVCFSSDNTYNNLRIKAYVYVIQYYLILK